MASVAAGIYGLLWLVRRLADHKDLLVPKQRWVLFMEIFAGGGARHRAVGTAVPYTKSLLAK